MTVLVTGAAGFIGYHDITKFVRNYPDFHIYNLEASKYKGNLGNIRDTENTSNYSFVKVDIRYEGYINSMFKKYLYDSIIHLTTGITRGSFDYKI